MKINRFNKIPNANRNQLKNVLTKSVEELKNSDLETKDFLVEFLSKFIPYL